MKRGHFDIVRLCFRFIRCPNRPDIKFNSQSRNETFTFAVFVGKDSQTNLERNLMSFTVVGKKGWLYEQSERLVKTDQAHLTVSGDAHYVSKLLQAGATDDKFLSKAGIWMPEPNVEKLNEVIAKYPDHLDPDPRELLKKRHMPVIQRELNLINCILPQNAYYGNGSDPFNGYRTKINVPISHELPDSMIYVPDASHVSPDGLHMSTRVCEKDLKLKGEFLLEKGRTEDFQQVQLN